MGFGFLLTDNPSNFPFFIIVFLILLMLMIPLVRRILSDFPNQTIKNIGNSFKLWAWTIRILFLIILFLVIMFLVYAEDETGESFDSVSLYLQICRFLMFLAILYNCHIRIRHLPPEVRIEVVVTAIVWAMIFFYLRPQDAKAEIEEPFGLFASESDDAILIPDLEYDYYRFTCPQAESIIRSRMAQIYSEQKDVSPALLRLFFHDCFIQGCDASILLDDSHGNKNKSIEKQAVPNKTLRGFDKVDLIKEEVEKACPGVVSCADILALATRDGIVLAGGPFFPILTGRRDSHRSYYEEALSDIPKPDDNITKTLGLFEQRGFTARETVSLLGGHNIGRISCEFIAERLYNFRGTGRPDPSIAPDFLNEMRLSCRDNSSSIKDHGSPASMSMQPSKGMSQSSVLGMSYLPKSIPSMVRSDSIIGGIAYSQELSSSIRSGAGFDTHYYRSLLRGRGLLFADQQLMAEQGTSRLVKSYASDDGMTFRRDFAQATMKMSNLNVLTGSQGCVRLNCSLPFFFF